MRRRKTVTTLFFGLRLPATLRDRLESVAASEDRTASYVARRALEREVSRLERAR